MRALWIVALIVAYGCLSRSVSAAELRRVAVVVGANAAPPGRAPLRYAYEDARHVADVLVAVAGFPAQNVKILLDPEPAVLLGALEQELSAAGKRSEDTLLFFYYSGHADDQALFPKGMTLPFSGLKARLEDPRAKLRVGLLDSCRGGSWTGSKGLRKVEPFELDAANALKEEGSVLIASSSGQENAHETEAFKGSFFTHHWNAGVRGAADRSGDGVVTLNEAFEYARALTIRDTALAGQQPQHPSFQMRLSGRRDFALSTLVRERTTLIFEQTQGPVEFVRLSDGLVVLESSPGARQLKLGLPVGGYLVRRRTPQGVWVRVVTLSPGNPLEIREDQLEPTRGMQGRSKDASSSEPPATSSWKHEGWYASIAAGVRHAPVIDPGLRFGAADGTGVAMLRLSVRLARHVWLSAPLSAVFDAERTGNLNYFLWGGAPVLGGALEKQALVLRGFLGLGADARYRQSARHTFNASLALLGAYALGEQVKQAPRTWTTQLSLGLSETVPGAVTFNLGVAVGVNPLVQGQLGGPSDAASRGLVIALGSVQRAGLRPLPLIHVPLGEAWSIDAHASAAFAAALGGWVETYTAGVSYQH